MPPFVSRKRARSPSPAASPPSKRKRATKPTLFETADAPTGKQKSVEESKKLLEELNEEEDEADELSEADSDDFEDVPVAKRRKVQHAEGADEGSSEDEEGMDWEDVKHSAQPGGADAAERHDIRDISFALKQDGDFVDPGVTVPGLGKKGPSKREKWIRVQSHCIHVQALLWHNTVRNSWLNDGQVQKTLVDGLTEGVKKEVARWTEAMGSLSKDELVAKKKAAAAAAATAAKGRKGKKGKGSGRDWTYDAEHAEQGVPNLSAGDPLLRLLKVLTAYWRKRFTVAAPAIRKQGYMPVKRLRDEIKHWEKNQGDAEEHGERIEDLEAFRELAKLCEGSRDVGGQLFAALLRGLGLETRMVVNLQPIGFGFSKAEIANPRNAKKESKASKADEDSDVVEVKPKEKASAKSLKAERPARQSGRGNKAQPINLDDSDSPLSDAPQQTADEEEEEEDDLSVVEITPPTPKKKPTKKYDRDLAFPTYWVEVCSPATHKYIPVDAIVLSAIASNDEILERFEPRGKKADTGKQVMAYTVAFSADGTAKDVTVRYLRKHQWPGKTKGMRIVAEKMPVYNRKGKVRRYEEYDWFRTVMSGYDRPHAKRTKADDLEDATDLVPQKAEGEKKEVEKESLQWYKQSAEYVLEQHLRREEALLPSAEPVRTFTPSTKKGAESKTSFPVFRRADVVTCKTVESWHKEGRALKTGEQPMKLVPVRAVTLIRKREIEDAQRETGEKPMQGLYSVDQTEWIIPPPIRNGVIPKNAFGNMDVYVPTMVPEGAVHIPLKGSAKLCRKLEIDYAEACTGFEFGKQRAVPVLTGVVVAEEHEILVREAWREMRAEEKRKEDTKRTDAALKMWRKMVLGLRVLRRMREEYAESGGGGAGVEVNPFVRTTQKFTKTREAAGEQQGGGGFFLPEHEEEEVPQTSAKRESSDGGGFLPESDDEAAGYDADAGGGFLVEDDADERAAAPAKSHVPVTPISLQSLQQMANDAADVDDDDGMVEREAGPEQSKHPNGRSRKKSSAQKVPAAKKALQGAGSGRKKQKLPTPPSEDASESPALSEADGDADSDGSCELPPRSAGPRKTGVSEAAVMPGKAPHVRGRRRKVTPKKSRYFSGQTGEDDEGAEDDEGEEEEEEEQEEGEQQEVAAPRRARRRTRAGRR